MNNVYQFFIFFKSHKDKNVIEIYSEMWFALKEIDAQIIYHQRHYFFFPGLGFIHYEDYTLLLHLDFIWSSETVCVIFPDG